MKDRLLHGWNWVRWFRLILAISFAIQAIISYDSIAGFFSLFLLFQVVNNQSCCGVSGCEVPLGKETSIQPEK